MKTVNARELQKKIKECMDMSQRDRVVITRRGKPAAIMVVPGNRVVPEY
jgi:prevent-host-death family protein